MLSQFQSARTFHGPEATAYVNLHPAFLQSKKVVHFAAFHPVFHPIFLKPKKKVTVVNNVATSPSIFHPVVLQPKKVTVVNNVARSPPVFHSVLLQPKKVVHVATSPPKLPSISYQDDSESTILDILTRASKAEGIALIEDIAGPSFSSIQALFDVLRNNPSLAARLNNTYPTRGVFKSAALTNTKCDQKLTIDLSRSRLSRIDESLRHELGQDLANTLDFFETTRETLVPRLLRVTSLILEKDLESMHAQSNVNYRLCDYRYPGSGSNAADAPNCGEHQDYGILTLIFQNGEDGLEYFCEKDGAWHPIPGDRVVFLWGLCAAVLSGGAIRACKHRVRDTKAGKRRNTAVLFLAPDTDAVLKPLVGDGKGFKPDVRDGLVTVGAFKEFSGRRWRRREGNLPDAPMGEDDDSLEAFLLE